MWGTDYPHPEGTWPHTQERLRSDFAGVPVEDARRAAGRDGGPVLRLRPRRAPPHRRAHRPDAGGPGPGPVPAHRPRGVRAARAGGRTSTSSAHPAEGGRERRPHAVLCQRGLAEDRPRVDPPGGAARRRPGDEAIEIGPGPGFTTDVLRTRTAHLMAVELDEGLAAALAAAPGGGNVDVVVGDATALEFGAGRFTGAASFHMLHHIAPADAQDRAFAELARVLVPGGVLVAATASTARAARPSTRTTPTTRSPPRSWRAGWARWASAPCGCTPTTSAGCAPPGRAERPAARIGPRETGPWPVTVATTRPGA